jgi:opacity protein-like surface antigen
MKKRSTVLILSLASTFTIAGGMGMDVLEPEDMTNKQDIIIEEVDEGPEGRFERSSHNNKFYAGVGFGGMKGNGENSAKGASISLITGYSLSSYASIEVRYATLIADADYGNTTKNITMSNVAIYLKQLLPLSSSFAPYGLLGYGSTNFDGDTDSGLQWGIGLNYMLNEKVTLFADYISHYSGDLDKKLVEDIDITSFNLGSTYKF